MTGTGWIAATVFVLYIAADWWSRSRERERWGGAVKNLVEFVEGLEERVHQLELDAAEEVKCAGCGIWYDAEQDACPACGSDDTKEYR